MKKQICILILLLTFNRISYALTNVSGFISVNTTWNLAGSPYIITGNVLVSSGCTLTINPGVIVKFNTNKAIQIDGELIAIGTSQNKIIFTSNQPIPVAGDWAKIHFSDSCVSAVFGPSGNYISGSIMKYCDIKYGGSLGFGMIHIITSSPYFSHCNISNSAADGIYSYETTYFIDSSSINYCSGSGLHFERYYLGNYCNITIQDNSILNNTGGGIKFDGYYASFMQCNYNHLTCIRRNVFYANSPFALIAPGSQNDSLIVSENDFQNNTGNGSTLEFSTTTYSIECNKFINNQTNAGILKTNYGDNYAANSSSFYIRNNIFQGNSITNNGASIILVSNNANYKDLFIESNIFQNNSVLSGQICSFGGQISSIFQIHNNNFINNIGQSNINLISPNGTGSNYQYFNMTNNNLVNPGCQYELKNNVTYGSPNIYINSNYWGTMNTQHIDSVIYDFFDFANQSVVYYLPILSSPTFIDTTCKEIITEINKIASPLLTIIFYPNPASNNFTIAFDKIIKNGMIEIFNVYGECIKQVNIHNDSKQEVNLESIPNGIFLIRLNDGEKFYCKKLIVEHN